MLFYSLCYAATMPLVNAVLFAATSDIGTQGKVFIWAPVAWALVGYTLTGWRMTRKTEGDGSDCLYFAAGLSVLMAIGCLLLPANPPADTGKIPVLEAMQMLADPNFLIFILISLVVVGLMQFYFLGTAQFLQNMGVSSKHVPGSMALAQVAQAVATWFLLGAMLGGVGFKWTLTIGAACWVILYLAYMAGKPRALIIGVQPLHGLAYVFFVIVGQIFAESVAPAAIRSSMQALIFTATMGVGLLAGTRFAGVVMDRNSAEGKFEWRRVWAVPCGIMFAGMLALLILFHDPPPQDECRSPPLRRTSHRLIASLPRARRPRPVSSLRESASTPAASAAGGRAFPEVALERHGNAAVAVQVAEPLAVLGVRESARRPSREPCRCHRAYFVVAGQLVGQQRGDDRFVLRPPEFHVVPVLLDRHAVDVAEIEHPAVLLVPAALPHPVEHRAARLRRVSARHCGAGLRA